MKLNLTVDNIKKNESSQFIIQNCKKTCYNIMSELFHHDPHILYWNIMRNITKIAIEFLYIFCLKISKPNKPDQEVWVHNTFSSFKFSQFHR